MSPVTLDCPFLIPPSIFSNLYLETTRKGRLITTYYQRKHHVLLSNIRAIKNGQSRVTGDIGAIKNGQFRVTGDIGAIKNGQSRVTGLWIVHF
jgi:hypothetical protein